MFIVWGTKAVETNLGTVADFCPVCRDARPFSLTRIGKASHVYGVSMGKGEHVGDLRRCDVCAVLLNADPSRYAGMVKNPGKFSIEELTHQTFPGLGQHHADRLALEAAIRQQPESIPANTRNSLMMEPFDLFGPVVQRRFSRRIDGYSILALLAALFVVTPILNMLLMLVIPGARDNPGIPSIISLLAALGSVVAFSRWNGRRYMRQYIYPYLARALAPLNPNRDEIRYIVQHVKGQGEPLGKRLKYDELMAIIAAQPQRLR